MDLKGFLQTVSTLLGSSAVWCKGASARKANGVYCAPLHPEAVSWDLYGAMVKCAHENNVSGRVFNEAYKHLRSKIPSSTRNKDIDYYNDCIEFGDIAGLLTVEDDDD